MNEKYFWEQFADIGEKHAFTLKNNEEFLGWVSEVNDDSVLVMWAPSPFYSQATGSDEMSPPDEWILFTDIITDSLAYWDKYMDCWRNYPGGERYIHEKVEECEKPKPWWKIW